MSTNGSGRKRGKKNSSDKRETWRQLGRGTNKRLNASYSKYLEKTGIKANDKTDGRRVEAEKQQEYQEDGGEDDK